jgi:hypothetical protein
VKSQVARTELVKSRIAWSDSISIPDDDGSVSLTETGYDTDNLSLDLPQVRTETSLFQSARAYASHRSVSFF